MCRQAWFPPGKAARNAKTLEVYLARLANSGGGHGNGCAIIDPTHTPKEVILKKGVAKSVSELAVLIANRPEHAWGVFHTRQASVGYKTDANCHPHKFYSSKLEEGIVLTHNGTWPGYIGVNVAWRTQFNTDSIAITQLIIRLGPKRKVLAGIGQTICFAFYSKSKGWTFHAYKGSAPLQFLQNGSFASEGTTEGEFREVCSLEKGHHDLNLPRVDYLFSSTSKSYNTSYTHSSTASDISTIDRRTSTAVSRAKAFNPIPGTTKTYNKLLLEDKRISERRSNAQKSIAVNCTEKIEHI